MLTWALSGISDITTNLGSGLEIGFMVGNQLVFFHDGVGVKMALDAVCAALCREVRAKLAAIQCPDQG